MSFIKKALCAAAVGGLALSAPAMAAPKSVSKLAVKDVRAGTKVKKAQRAEGGSSTVTILLIGSAVVVAGVAAATAGSS